MTLILGRKIKERIPTLAARGAPLRPEPAPPAVRELEAAIREFIAVHNEAPKPFVWAKTADQILASIARYAQRALAAHSQQLISRTTGTGH